jgi:hypothetical protein
MGTTIPPSLQATVGGTARYEIAADYLVALL